MIIPTRPVNGLKGDYILEKEFNQKPIRTKNQKFIAQEFKF